MLALATPLVHAAPDLSTGAELFRLVLSLAAVVGLIFAAGWASRRLQGGRHARGARRMRCLEVLPLGPRERVLLLEVDGQRLVVGVGAGGLRTLWTGGANDVPPPMDVPADGKQEVPTERPGLFRTLLDQHRRSQP